MTGDRKPDHEDDGGLDSLTAGFDENHLGGVRDTGAGPKDHLVPFARAEDFVRNDFDARFLAVLWCIRKAFAPTLLLGLILGMAYFLVVAGDASAFMDELGALDSPGELASSVFSPFFLVVIAIGGRIVLGFVALGAAYPLVLMHATPEYRYTNRTGRFIRKWADRWKMSSAYRSARWTWYVRSAVLDRMDAWGTWWRRWDILMVVLNIVLGIVAFVMLLLVAAQLPEEVVSGQ